MCFSLAGCEYRMGFLQCWAVRSRTAGSDDDSFQDNISLKISSKAEQYSMRLKKDEDMSCEFVIKCLLDESNKKWAGPFPGFSILIRNSFVQASDVRGKKKKSAREMFLVE